MALDKDFYKQEGEIAPFTNGCPAGPPKVIRAKANMADSHYQEIII